MNMLAFIILKQRRRLLMNDNRKLTYASERVARRQCPQITGTVDAEVRAGGAPLGLLQAVPEEVDLLRDETAGNLLPVDAGVGGVGDGLVDGLAGDGPAGLGDPDGLAAGELDGLVVAVVEARHGVADAVRLCGLPVRVPVEADEVDGRDDGLVSSVQERVVGVDVTDGGSGQRRAGDGRADLLDAVYQVGGRRAHLARGVSVEILATHRNTDDEAGEFGTVFVDGGFEGRDLIGKGLRATRDPETEEQLGIRLDGCRDGLHNVGLCSPLH